MPAGDTLRPDLASRDPSPPPAIYDRVERDAKFGKQQADLVQVHNECDVTQTLPDELPAIDIHSLSRHSMPRCRPPRSAVACRSAIG
jgi:hypothetical protein